MSKGPEGKLWDYLQKNLKGSNTHLTRVESHATAVGVPDVNFCLDGVDGWAELKAENTKGLVLRKSQRAWARDRIKAGADNVYIIWTANVEYTDVRGKQTVYGLIHCTSTILQELSHSTKPVVWAAYSDVVWNSNINFDDLRKGLTSHGR